MELDATDQLEQANPLTTAMSINPMLAALEILLYPKSATVIANDVLAAVGTIEIVPLQGAMTLFVWGPQRILPVRLTGLEHHGRGA